MFEKSVYPKSYKDRAIDYLEEAKEQNRVREEKERKYVVQARENLSNSFENARKEFPSIGKLKIKDKTISRHQRVGEIGYTASNRVIGGLNGLFKGLARAKRR